MDSSIISEDGALFSRSGLPLFGYCLDILLYGILTVQTYLYYLAFPNDRHIIKGTVYFVYLVGTVQVAFALHDFYQLFCTPWGRHSLAFEDLHSFGYAWITIAASIAIVSFVVQMLYAYRIYVALKQSWIACFVTVLAVAQLGIGIYAAASLYQPHPLTKRFSVAADIIVCKVWGSISACCDVFIAAYMSYILMQRARDTSKRTQAHVTRIIRILVETGTMTATVAIIHVLTSTLVPHRLNSYMITGLALGNLHANSMLVLLNSRFTIEGGRNAKDLSFDIPSLRTNPPALAELLSPRSVVFAHTNGVSSASTILADGTVANASSRSGARAKHLSTSELGHKK